MTRTHAAVSLGGGETVVTRYTLRELLDKLHELTGGQSG